MKANVIKLHVAESVKQLNGFVDDSKVDVNKTGIKLLMNSLKRMYDAAKDAWVNGDEEKAYILYMRTFNLYMKIRKRSDWDTYCCAMFDDGKVKECVEMAETLFKSLERRYEELQGNSVAKNHAAATDKASDTSSTDGNNHVNNLKSPNDEKTNTHREERSFIECTELFEFIEKFMLKNKDNSTAMNQEPVLLIDVRSAEDYENSRMKFEAKQFDTSKITLINIPENFLKEGLTMKKMESSLSLSVASALQKRSTAKVVIFDWSSKSIEENKYLKIVFDALVKFDTSTVDRVKEPPLILKSGYEEWVLTYPAYTTNSKVEAPRTHVPSNKTESKSVKFDVLLDSISDAPKESKKEPLVNGIAVEPPKPMRNGVQELARKFDNLLTDNPAIKAPGSAKAMPIIDRTKKPQVPTSTAPLVNGVAALEDDSTQLQLKRLLKQKECEEQMRKELQEKEEQNLLEREKLAEEHRKLLKENIELKRNLKPKNEAPRITEISMTPSTPESVRDVERKDVSLDRSPVSSRRNAMGGDEVVLPLPKRAGEGRPLTERTMSESTGPGPRRSSLISQGKQGLSRSHSSPNIAKLLQEEIEEETTVATSLSKSKSTTHPPQFDRTLKPATLMNDITKPVYACSARSRNFQPIYGSAGQSITGLKNLGNTCFMNSVIQCLVHTVGLANYFSLENHLKDINKNSKFGSKGEIALELGALVRELLSGHCKSLSPKDFKMAVGIHMPFFVGNDQQDSHEFLVMLLEKLHADLNRAVHKNEPFEIKDDIPTHLGIKTFWENHVLRNQSIISELFEGLLLSTLTCQVCGKTSNSFEVFSCLSLPIPSNMGNRCSLLDCFKLFSEQEHLSGEAAWDCPTCKTKRNAVKKIVLCRFPRVLVVHLKRFSYEGMWRQKLQTHVEFPLTELNLKHYKYVNQNDTSQTCTYNLYGVVNHYGTLEGGHYIAYCKNTANQKWYKFDDHEVTDLSTGDIRSQAAYVLFYTASNLP